MVWTWAASSALSIFGGPGGPPPPSSAMKLAYSSSIVTRPLAAAPLARLGLKSAPLAAVLPQVAGSTPLSSSLSVPLICQACGRTPQGAVEAVACVPTPLARSHRRKLAHLHLLLCDGVVAVPARARGGGVGWGGRGAEGSGHEGLLSSRVCDGAASRRAATTPSPPDNRFRGASARVEDSLHKRLPLLDALLVGPAGPGARGQHYRAIPQQRRRRRGWWGGGGGSKPRTRTLQ